MAMPQIIKETPQPWNGRRVTAYRLENGDIGVEVTRWQDTYQGKRWTITHTRTFKTKAA